jgi:hypothetical protein
MRALACVAVLTGTRRAARPSRARFPIEPLTTDPFGRVFDHNLTYLFVGASRQSALRTRLCAAA